MSVRLLLRFWTCPRFVVKLAAMQTLHSQYTQNKRRVHSSKILTIQQGVPRGVSSVGNPRGPLTGFNILPIGSLKKIIALPSVFLDILKWLHLWCYFYSAFSLCVV